MSEVTANKFACEGCGRKYTWKNELAGRRVKCKCGQVMTVPAEPPSAESDEDALYALADIEEKASKNQPVTVVNVPPTPSKPKKPAGAGAGVGLRAAGVPLAYQNGPTARERERGDVTMDV